MKTVCENSLTKYLISNQHDLREWTQPTIQDYFEFCVKKQVLSRMDIENGIIELKGSPTGVSTNCLKKKFSSFDVTINHFLF